MVKFSKLFKKRPKPIELDGFIVVGIGDGNEAFFTGLVSSAEALEIYDRYYASGAKYVEAIQVKVPLDAQQYIDQVLKNMLEATAHWVKQDDKNKTQGDE